MILARLPLEGTPHPHHLAVVELLERLGENAVHIPANQLKPRVSQ